MEYPIFKDPAGYLKTRRGSWVLSFIKQRGEQQALDRCLASLPDIRLVCDVPCGFGHLFPYWHRKKFRIIGMDLSEPMVISAKEVLRKHKISGDVLYGDIFSLLEHLQERPDLIACVRFIYYFERSQRGKLLQTLAAASNRYVLVQYKSTDTLRGKMVMDRKRKQGMPISKQFCSLSEIEEEFEEAGLTAIRMVPISQFSDRVFIIANKRF
jgi:predicted TPR repeat methyltransferase